MTRSTVAIDIKDIFKDLRTNYGQPTPQERTDMETKLNMPYDPSSKAIEVLFEEYKQVLLWSLDCTPPYTEDQIVQKLHDRIEECGHFALAIEKWQSITPKDWITFRAHMVPAYTTYCKTSGSYTARAAGYANSSIIDDDDRSLQSLVQTQDMMNQAINLNNANVSNTNSSLSTLDSNQQSLNAKMNEMANQMMQLNAAMTRIGMTNTMPAYPPPPVVYPPTNYIPQAPQAPPSYVPHAGTYTGGRSGGGRGRRSGRGGRGRGGAGRGSYIPPVGTGGIPPPTQQYQQAPPAAPYSNTRKRFNNHNMCYTCGHDVPYWHTSLSCPHELRKHGHQEGCDHTNWREYQTAGHKPSMKASHKIGNMPLNPGPNQA